MKYITILQILSGVVLVLNITTFLKGEKMKLQTLLFVLSLMLCFGAFMATTANGGIIEDLDNLAEKTPAFTEAGDRALDNPIVQVIVPKPINSLVHFIGNILLGLSSIWFWFRKKKYKEAVTELASTAQSFLNDTPTGNQEYINAMGDNNMSRETTALADKVSIPATFKKSR